MSGFGESSWSAICFFALVFGLVFLGMVVIRVYCLRLLFEKAECIWTDAVLYGKALSRLALRYVLEFEVGGDLINHANNRRRIIPFHGNPRGHNVVDDDRRACLLNGTKRRLQIPSRVND